jgi:hypothetical protein
MGWEVGPPGVEGMRGVWTGRAKAGLTTDLITFIGKRMLVIGGLMRMARNTLFIKVIEQRRAVGEAEEK